MQNKSKARMREKKLRQQTKMQSACLAMQEHVQYVSQCRSWDLKETQKKRKATRKIEDEQQQ
jgi:hypothetical protein